MRSTYEDAVWKKQTVAARGLRWTFIRPGRLLDEPADHHYRVVDGANPRRGTAFTRADVEALAVQCATDDAWIFVYRLSPDDADHRASIDLGPYPRGDP